MKLISCHPKPKLDMAILFSFVAKNKLRARNRTSNDLQTPSHHGQAWYSGCQPLNQTTAVAQGKSADQRELPWVDSVYGTQENRAMSEQLSPKQLVKDLHECFSQFDRICEKYGIEKIKTIGDA